MMMKRILQLLLLFILCIYTAFSGTVSDDGYLTAGEYDYSAWLEANDKLIVIGGGAYEIVAKDNSSIEVQHTSTPLGFGIGGIMDVILDDFAGLVYLGGITEEVTISENAMATLYGGRIDYITSKQYVGWLGRNWVGPHIEMFVKDYDYNPAIKLLTGTWGDDTTFNIQLLNQSGYSPVIDNIKFTIIPEPASLVLLGLGGLLLRRKR